MGFYASAQNRLASEGQGTVPLPQKSAETGFFAGLVSNTLPMFDDSPGVLAQAGDAAQSPKPTLMDGCIG